MAGGGVKGFYRQMKKGGVAKPKPSMKASRKKQLNCSQPQDGGSPGDEEQELLRIFDMDMKYGPCIGITRLRRWERAAALGLCPLARLRELLLPTPPPANPSSSSSSSPAKIISTAVASSNSISVSTSVQADCLWAAKFK